MIEEIQQTLKTVEKYELLSNKESLSELKQNCETKINEQRDEKITELENQKAVELLCPDNTPEYIRNLIERENEAIIAHNIKIDEKINVYAPNVIKNGDNIQRQIR